tara:strand:+ start:4358 stop:5596 length:1239 start_codon:yes stop_codon:yes gene_type:complete
MKLYKLYEEVLSEAEYNYHYGGKGGDIDTKKPEPHGSDNIFSMSGRDTGHFGSGLYFSTYKCYDRRDADDKYGQYSEFEFRGGKNNPQLIQVNGGLYRVDMDLYKNLYRVTSDRHGEILYKTLREINELFYSVGNQYLDKFNLHSDVGETYVRLKHNMNKIGLDLPKYLEFIRILQKGHKDVKNVEWGKIKYDKVSSFASMSTRIMEWNGYNGVNVSNIYKYDNTTHGSVIYDMSKIDTEPREVKNPDFLCKIEYGVASSGYDDIKAELLKILKTNGELTSVDKYNKLPEDIQLMFMKRYNKFMGFWGKDLSSKAKEIYLKTMPYKLKNLKMEGEPEFEVIKYLVDSGNIDIIYNPNIKIKGHGTFLDFIIKNAAGSYGYDEEFMLKIIKGVPRKLTPDEQDSFDEWKEYWD